MKRKIISPQKSDMGSGLGKYEFENEITLKEFLEYYKNNSNTWGCFTIKYSDNQVLRKFDYDIYSKNKIFYCDLSWENEIKIKEVKFEYCFMNEDIIVVLEK